MTSYLKEIVNDMIVYLRLTEMENLYNRLFADDNKEHDNVRENLIDWINEMLDLSEIPEGKFRKSFIDEYLYNYDDKTTELIDFIYTECGPEEQKRCKEELSEMNNGKYPR